MDLPGLAEVRLARTRADLAALTATVAPLAGGTWLYSEPQPTLTGLVDLTTLGWTPWERRADGGLSVAATCTVRQLVEVPADAGRAVPLFRACAESLLQSSKVWDTATVGGNLATALAAGALIGLAAALDAEVVIWTADGERRSRVPDLVLGQRATTLAPGEVIRSIEVGPAAMASATAFRRTALSALGRAGVVVAGSRTPDGALVVAVTGGTVRPEVLRFPASPPTAALGDAVTGLRTWFDDAHGAADWRRAMGLRLAEEIRQELAP